MFGRIDGEVVSGHWVYAFLRHDRESGQKFLCVVNFHPLQSMMNLRVIIPLGAIGDEEWADCYEFVDQLTGASYGRVVTSMIIEQGMHVSSISPLQALMLEWKKVSA
jgi:hypothetical protein